MQKQGGKPEGKGRTHVRSRRLSGEANAAVAQNIEKSAAYARKAARRAAENIAAQAARIELQARYRGSEGVCAAGA